MQVAHTSDFGMIPNGGLFMVDKCYYIKIANVDPVGVNVSTGYVKHFADGEIDFGKFRYFSKAIIVVEEP